MRFALFSLLALFLAVPAVQAQSIINNIPAPPMNDDAADDADIAPPAKETGPAAAAAAPETYTVADVNADVTADTSAHARDQALMQAERNAFTQLCQRLGLPDSATFKLNDDAVAALVQSFEVQSERLSAVRYIGVFTIRFKQGTVQKKFAKNLGAATDAATGPAKPAIDGPVSHMTVAVKTETLASWAQIRKRLNAAPPVTSINVLDLGRGLTHIDLAYGGGVGDLQAALTTQGLVLRQNANGIWELYDGSMVAR